MSNNNITPGHVTAFQMVRSSECVTLANCTVNDEPGVAIVAFRQAGRNAIEVMPLFVAITESMNVDFSGEVDSEDGGGEPTREDAKKEVTLHWRDAPRR